MLTQKEYLEKKNLFNNEHGKSMYRQYRAIRRSTSINRSLGNQSPPENNPEIENGQYSPLYFRQTDCPAFKKKFKSPLLLSMYFRRYVVRAPSKSDKYDIYNRYYKHDNKFACTMSIRRLAKEFSCSDKTIQSWIKLLKDSGMLKVEYINIGHGRRQSVFISGCYQAGKPFFYMDEIPVSDDI